MLNFAEFLHPIHTRILPSLQFHCYGDLFIFYHELLYALCSPQLVVITQQCLAIPLELLQPSNILSYFTFSYVLLLTEEKNLLLFYYFVFYLMQQLSLFTPDETNQPHLLSRQTKNMAMKVLMLLLIVFHPLVS